MKYVFIRQYNPAYDFFLIRYLREGGIEFDDQLTFAEVEPRWLFAAGKTDLTPHEKVFFAYMDVWRLHPESRPSFYYLLEKTWSQRERFDVRELRELEFQLSATRGKLLFTIDEVASDISEFFRKYLRKPLKEELEGGGGWKEVSEYFSRKETDLMPHRREVGQEEFDKAAHKIANELVTRLETITPEKVLRDIESVLEEHEKTPNHMELTGSITDSNKKQWVCRHESESVELRVYRGVENGSPTMFLTPARGFEISDHVLEPGYNDIVFPWYYVKEVNS